jgi:DNA-binding response OmpR family regulator
MRILLIEDHPLIADNLSEYLRDSGHAVEHAVDGRSGLSAALAEAFDVIILDVMLPRLDGLELCRRLRSARGLLPPVLMLTARDTLEDKLEGFAAGADDYLVKPFANAEVEARIQALHRRSVNQDAPTEIEAQTLKVEDLSFDLGTMSVTRGDRRLRLTRIALQILELLMRSSPRIVERDTLQSEVWGDYPISESVLRTHVWALRREIDPEGTEHPLVHTVHGLGYRLCLDEEVGRK